MQYVLTMFIDEVKCTLATIEDPWLLMLLMLLGLYPCLFNWKQNLNQLAEL